VAATTASRTETLCFRALRASCVAGAPPRALDVRSAAPAVDPQANPTTNVFPTWDPGAAHDLSVAIDRRRRWRSARSSRNGRVAPKHRITSGRISSGTVKPEPFANACATAFFARSCASAVPAVHPAPRDDRRVPERRHRTSSRRSRNASAKSPGPGRAPAPGPYRSAFEAMPATTRWSTRGSPPRRPTSATGTITSYYVTAGPTWGQPPLPAGRAATTNQPVRKLVRPGPPTSARGARQNDRTGQDTALLAPAPASRPVRRPIRAKWRRAAALFAMRYRKSSPIRCDGHLFLEPIPPPPPFVYTRGAEMDVRVRYEATSRLFPAFPAVPMPDRLEDINLGQQASPRAWFSPRPLLGRRSTRADRLAGSAPVLLRPTKQRPRPGADQPDARCFDWKFTLFDARPAPKGPAARSDGPGINVGLSRARTTPGWTLFSPSPRLAAGEEAADALDAALTSFKEAPRGVPARRTASRKSSTAFRPAHSAVWLVHTMRCRSAPAAPPPRRPRTRGHRAAPRSSDERC